MEILPRFPCTASDRVDRLVYRLFLAEEVSNIEGKAGYNGTVKGDLVARSEAVRNEIHRLIRATPFRRFLLVLESGDRVLIEHPENIAFDPGAAGGNDEFYVITGRVRLFSTFGAVSSVALADVEGAAA